MMTSEKVLGVLVVMSSLDEDDEPRRGFVWQPGEEEDELVCCRS